MRDLPSGTVTFLFTDIEGSTRLLQRTRERYADLLSTHNELLRAACRAHDGHEMGTEGDAFFFAFGRARDAVDAAVAAQRALASHAWPPGEEVRVRMGIHTGEPDVREEGYLGLALHRVARISDAGHGGQVLVSRATTELVEDELPPGISLRDLGAHRLKDFERPQPIFQLVAEGLRSEFPPLKAIEAQPARSISGALEEQIVRAQTTTLKAAPDRPLHRRPLVLAMLAGVLAAAVSIPIFAPALPDDPSSAGLDGNLLVSIDPATNTVQSEVTVGTRPGDVVYGGGALWVANLLDETVMRIDPAAGRVVRTFPTGAPPSALAATSDAVWLVTDEPGSSKPTLSRIRPAYNLLERVGTISGAVYGGGRADAAAGDGDLWVLPGGVGVVSRIDAAGSAVEIDAGSCCLASIAFGGGSAWVADPYVRTVTRIASNSLVDRSIAVKGRPAAIGVHESGVWVPLSLEGAVARIDPTANAVDDTIAVGRAPVAVAFGDSSAWVANSGDGTISRIDPSTNQVVATIEVPGSPRSLVFASGRLWASLQEKGAASGDDSEGVARLSSSVTIGSLDPALAYEALGQGGISRSTVSWQIEYATCAKLLNYADRAAPAGSQLEPDVAVALPSVSRDGRTYTFRLRSGFRFSRSRREQVTAATFKFAIERSLSPAINGPASLRKVASGNGARATLHDIVGARAYADRRAPHISGIQAKGMTLRITLERPSADFLQRLAQPFFCAVPRDLPLDPRGVTTLASAGPYFIASYTPGRRVVLKRNPNYGGRRPHRLRELVISFGVGSTEILQGVERNPPMVDYAIDSVPSEERQRLSREYGVSSRLGRAGRPRYFVNPTLDVWFIALNTTRPAFASPAVRRAVNFAVNRTDLARFVAPFLSLAPTDQHLPPGTRGFQDARIYPFVPDLATARRLIGGRRIEAVLYTCAVICAGPTRAIGDYLAAVGIDVEFREHSFAEVRRKLGTRGEPFDLTVTAWSADYPDGSVFLDVLFDGNALRPTGNNNIAYLDDPSVNRELARARALTGRARAEAYGRLDVRIARDLAPFAVLGYRTTHDFFSARMGCQVYHPVYGIDLARLCIR